MTEWVAVFVALTALLTAVFFALQQGKINNRMPEALYSIATEVRAAAEIAQATREDGRSEATNAQARTKVAGIRAALYREYVLSHDGISPAIMAGTGALPDAWVDAKLSEWGVSEPERSLVIGRARQ
jgi:hypothetical protein